MNDAKTTIHRFRQLEFTALTPLDNSQVEVQFEGKFKNRAVTWDATISSLFCSTEDKGKQHSNCKQAITIQPLDAKHLKVNIELAVDIITEATVFKTMLMIHNYKKLDLGRHEFGSITSIPSA